MSFKGGFTLGGVKKPVKLGFGLPSRAKPKVPIAFAADSDDEDGGGNSAEPAKPPADPEVQKVADKLAQFVAANGRSFETITKERNPGDTPFRFLFDTGCSDYKYYELKIKEFSSANAPAGGNGPSLPLPPSSAAHAPPLPPQPSEAAPTPPGALPPAPHWHQQPPPPPQHQQDASPPSPAGQKPAHPVYQQPYPQPHNPQPHQPQQQHQQYPPQQQSWGQQPQGPPQQPWQQQGYQQQQQQPWQQQQQQQQQALPQQQWQQPGGHPLHPPQWQHHQQGAPPSPPPQAHQQWHHQQQHQHQHQHQHQPHQAALSQQQPYQPPTAPSQAQPPAALPLQPPFPPQAAAPLGSQPAASDHAADTAAGSLAGSSAPEGVDKASASRGGLSEAQAAKAEEDSLAAMEKFERMAREREAARVIKEKREELLNETSFDRRRQVSVLKKDGSRGHHMNDYIPEAEMAKFMASAKDPQSQAAAAAMEEKQKIQSDNVGHKLLSKMGWKEGQGLGASNSGIAAPVAATGAAGGGPKLGLGTQEHGAVEEGDDAFETYRKRMMLGYKHRPNPLGNPRKNYY